MILFVVCCASITSECTAQPPEGRPRFGQGQRPPGAAPQADGAQLVARFIREFDRDGDMKLDADELTSLFKSLRERRAAMGQGGQLQGPGGFPRRPNANEPRRQPPTEQANTPGGEIPKRPLSE